MDNYKAPFADGHDGIGHYISNPQCIMTSTKCPFCGHAHEDIDDQSLHSCDDCDKVFAIGFIGI